jgi:hypothetical protein
MDLNLMHSFEARNYQVAGRIKCIIREQDQLKIIIQPLALHRIIS